MVQPVPIFLGARHAHCYGWLHDLMVAVKPAMRVFMHQWHLIHLVIMVKRFSSMRWNWESLAALIELWDPDTHTFVFPELEASVLVEKLDFIFQWGDLEVGR